MAWLDAELVRGGQEDLGVGLAVREIASGDVYVEVVQQRQAGPQRRRRDPLLLREGVEPDLAQEQPRVLRRGRVRDAHPGILGRDDETQGVGIGGEVAGLDKVHDHFLFTLRVLGDALVSAGHVEVVKGGAGPGHARLARDVLLVDVRRERVRRPCRLSADVAPARLHQLAQ
jgi:hypothetical protein